LAIMNAVERPARRAVNGQLESLARELRGVWATVQITGVYPETAAPGDLHWSIVDSRGEVFLSEVLDAEGVVLPDLGEAEGSYRHGIVDTAIGTLALAQQTRMESPPVAQGEREGEAVAVTYTAAMNAPRHADLIAERADALRQAALRAFLAFGALMLGVIAALVAVVLIPLRRLDRAAEAYDAGETVKIEGHHPSEIAAIVAKLNASIDRNASLVERTRRYIGKIAHDLKHPLAIARNALATGDGKETATGRLVAMDATLDRYASLATSIGPDGPQPAFPLAPFLDDAKAGFELLYRATPVTIRVDCDPALAVRMARSDLDAMVTNLMSNAHRHARSRIEVTASAQSGALRLSIADDGPGLDEESRSQATAWGERLDSATPGSGFGLAIVTDLAELYDGTLTLNQSDLGGLDVTITLDSLVT